MWTDSIIGLVLVGFGLPFGFLVQRRSGKPTLESLVDSLSVGYACAFVLLFLGAQLRLWLFVPIWLLAALASIAIAIAGRKAERGRVELGAEGKALLAASGFYLVLRCLPFLARREPLGWDAYFHMTIIESIARKGQAVQDWLPYENIPLNYPIGGHLLLALTEWLTKVRPHLFFDGVVVWFTLLTGLQVFSLSSRATNDRALGCYAALAYLFLADMGSLQYVVWSGLPNLIGFYLFLGLLTGLLDDAPVRVENTLVFVVCLLAACFVHHHVMVTAALCLVSTAGACFLSGDRVRAKRIFIGLLATGVLGAPYFLKFLARASELRKTGLGDHLEYESTAWGLVLDLGLGFAVCVAAGAYLRFRKSLLVARVHSYALATLLVVYVGIAFGLRTLSSVLGRETAPFTPSRFLTDAVPLLALYAGVFFRSIPARAPLNAPICAVIVGSFIFFNRDSYKHTFSEVLPRARIETYEWIRDNTDPKTAVLDKDLHATYFTERLASSFPLPTSEFRALTKNKRLLQAIERGKRRPNTARRPIVAVVEPKKSHSGRTLYSHPSGFRVVEVAR